MVPSAQSAKNKRLVDLLAACALHNQHAFAQLYKLCSPTLFGVLLRILRHQQQAEEALQETFVKIWENAASYQSDRGSPMAWMTSIARYRALDMLRRAKAASSHEEFEELSPQDEPADTADPYQSLTINQESGTLKACLAQLEEGMRTSLVLAYCQGYTHKELSRRLETPIGTVKSWIRRGLQRLKSCMDELS